MEQGNALNNDVAKGLVLLMLRQAGVCRMIRSEKDQESF
jgi:hypothetical protein